MLRKIAEFLSKYPRIKFILKDSYQIVGNLFSDKESTMENLTQVSTDQVEHLFGYYDKSPWNAKGNKMIYLAVDKADKYPTSSSPANIILKELNNNEEIVIGQTRSWNVQQGCMLQWLGPDFNSKIIYNDFRNGKNCSVVLDINSGNEKVLRSPVYSVSSNGKFAITLDFSRLNSFRPGYGYSNLSDTTANEKIPNSYCLWNLNLETNDLNGIIKYSDLANLEMKTNMNDAFHKVNHVMLNPSGNRFMFLHRWIKNGVKYDRLITCDITGGNQYILLDDDMVSHSNWKDDSTILTWAKTEQYGNHYYLLEDLTVKREVFAEDIWTVDGHPSYSPDGNWIVTDTYPDFKRKQKLMLYNIPENKYYELLNIYSNIKYRNETRCDLHPRWSHDSTKICFDGSLKKYRQIYVVDVFNNEKKSCQIFDR